MTMNAPRRRVVRWLAVFALVGGTSAALEAVAAAPDGAPSWGAIAARPGGYGYAFNQPSQATAERLARAQCDRAPGRAGPAAASGGCEVRASFDRSCGALATGNFGEWGTALAARADAAGKAAVAQCDGHLPTEPCKLVVSVCSLP